MERDCPRRIFSTFAMVRCIQKRLLDFPLTLVPNSVGILTVPSRVSQAIAQFCLLLT